MATSLLWLSASDVVAQTTSDPAPRESITPTPIDSTVIVTGEEIERRQWRTLTDLLQHQPGVHARQQGGAGQFTELYFRGQRQGRVLLRVDGIEVSDPLLDDDPGRIVPELLLVDVDRVEIRRGPHSVLAGSDAVGGVIDIYTKRGSGDLSTLARFEGGSFGTTLGTLALRGGAGDLGYQLAYTNLKTKGVTARRRDFGSDERDDYTNGTLQGRLDFDVNESLSLSVTGRMIHSQLDTDSFTGLIVAPTELNFVNPQSAGDDLNQEDARQLQLGGTATLRLFDDRWTQRFQVGYSSHDRAGGLGTQTAQFQLLTGPFVNAGSFITSNITNVRFDGRGSDSSRLKLGWENEIAWAPGHILRLGAETERESIHQSSVASRVLTVSTPAFQIPAPQSQGIGTGAASAVSFSAAANGGATFPASTSVSTIVSRTSLHGSARNLAVYAQEEFSFERWSGELGVRLQDQDDFGSRLGYRAALSYLEPTTQIRLFGSIATGSRDPNLRSVSRSRRTTTTTDLFATPTGVASVPATFSESLAGNPDLEPEIVRGIEVGALVPLPNQLGSLRLAYFRTRTRGISDRVTVFGFGLFGLPLAVSTDSTKTRTQGVEASAQIALAPNLGLGVNYTYTSAEVRHTSLVVPAGIDVSDSRDERFIVGPRVFLGLGGGSDELGIPKHLVDVSLTYSPIDSLELIFGLRYVGKRKESLGIFPETVGGFTTFDLAFRYQLRDDLRLFGRVINASDKEFHDPIEANGPERAAYVGLELSY